ncbi:(Fe-S)-binding protein [Jatrophihabitans fulvus]
MRVALFMTCLGDVMAPQVLAATTTVLRRVGVEVEVPRTQTCCGQMHVNTGYPAMATDLVRNHARTFAGYDAVVAASASCVGSVRHQHPTLARATGDAALEADVAALGPRTYELSEFLIDVLGVEDVGARFPHRVTYHPTCHSLRLLRVGDRPLRLLRRVDGLELLALPGAESCCGFGGTFAVKNSGVSSAMLADKCADVTATGAEYCVSADASCLLHIGGGLSRQQRAVRTIHLAEVLAS